MRKSTINRHRGCAITTLSVKVFAQTKITNPGKLENKIQSSFSDSRLVLKANRAWETRFFFKPND
ncbi:MAG: hypothetical protein WKF59_16745 [Chitinophagaceae bacterium]